MLDFVIPYWNPTEPQVSTVPMRKTNPSRARLFLQATGTLADSEFSWLGSVPVHVCGDPHFSLSRQFNQ